VELLNRYWNERGGPEAAATSTPLDPSLIDTLEELYARDDARAPDSRILDRVEQALRDEIARGHATAPPAPPGAIGPNGHAPATIPSTWSPTRASASRWSFGWPVQPLATATLVVLTLLGSIAAIRGVVRPANHDNPVTTMTAIDNTPQTATQPGQVQESVLMQGTFATFPPYASWEGIARATLAPGTAFDLGRAQNDGEGPLLYRVEFGELTVNADGPIRVVRAGATEATTIPAGTEVVLREGDQGFAPSGVSSRWRNDRQVPTIVLDAGIATYGSGVLPPGVTHEPMVATYATAPKNPVDVVVRRVTLSPAALLTLDLVPGLQLLYLESGQLQVIPADTLAMAANPLETSGPVKGVRTVTGGPVFSGVIPKGSGIRVAETGPATLLMLTVVDHDGAAPMG
jgi:hypothetical protein